MDYLRLAKNASFYELIAGKKITRNEISSLLTAIGSVRIGMYYVKGVRIKAIVGVNINLSIVAFLRKNTPSCLDKTTPNLKKWEETKFAYFLLIEYEGYVVVIKKNVGAIGAFTEKLKEIDYALLEQVFVNEKTTFQKININNLDISDSAMRAKTLESINLQQSLPIYGNSNYMLNSCCLTYEGNRLAVAMNTSRINYMGQKDGIDELLKWVIKTIDLLKAPKGVDVSSNFLSTFGKPLAYEDYRDKFRPNAILFLSSKIQDYFERDDSYEIIYKGRVIPYNLFIQYFLYTKEVHEHSEGEVTHYYIPRKGKDYKKCIQIVKNKNKIVLRGQILKDIELKKDGHTVCTLNKFMNDNQLFIIHSNTSMYRYANRKIFDDHKMLEGIKLYYDFFKPYKKLSHVTSEKGDIQKTSTSFDKECIFGFVESLALTYHTILLCDDLGTEWADHIGIDENAITFYISKFGDSKFSATAFHDVVAQAQKNLGNFYPLDKLLNSKKDTWSKNYASSSIKRIRTEGKSSEEAVAMWREVTLRYDMKRKVVLVINFLSKALLIEKMNKLKDNIDFPEKKEAVPMLWMISSLAASCWEQNVAFEIWCKE